MEILKSMNSAIEEHGTQTVVCVRGGGGHKKHPRKAGPKPRDGRTRPCMVSPTRRRGPWLRTDDHAGGPAGATLSPSNLVLRVACGLVSSLPPAAPTLGCAKNPLSMRTARRDPIIRDHRPRVVQPALVPAGPSMFLPSAGGRGPTPPRRKKQSIEPALLLQQSSRVRR